MICIYEYVYTRMYVYVYIYYHIYIYIMYTYIYWITPDIKPRFKWSVQFTSVQDAKTDWPQESCRCFTFRFGLFHTVDGSEIRRSPVEVGSFYPLFIGFKTSQVVVWDFYHQQYGFLGFIDSYLVNAFFFDFEVAKVHSEHQDEALRWQVPLANLLVLSGGPSDSITSLYSYIHVPLTWWVWGRSQNEPPLYLTLATHGKSLYPE